MQHANGLLTPRCGSWYTTAHCTLGYWKACPQCCFTEARGERPSLSCEHARPSTWSHIRALTGWQSPGLPRVPRGQPVLSSNALTKLREWFRGGWSPVERPRRTSVSWPELQAPPPSWVEGFSVSVEGTTLSRRNNGTENTECFVWKLISPLPWPHVFDGDGWVRVHGRNL